MLQKRLIEQTQKLEETEKKLKVYENMNRCSCQPAVDDVGMITEAVGAGAVRTAAMRAVSLIQGLFSYRRLLIITQCLHRLVDRTS
jgi:hypothetical protein